MDLDHTQSLKDRSENQSVIIETVGNCPPEAYLAKDSVEHIKNNPNRSPWKKCVKAQDIWSLGVTLIFKATGGTQFWSLLKQIEVGANAQNYQSTPKDPSLHPQHYDKCCCIRRKPRTSFAPYTQLSIYDDSPSRYATTFCEMLSQVSKQNMMTNPKMDILIYHAFIKLLSKKC